MCELTELSHRINHDTEISRYNVHFIDAQHSFLKFQN